MTSWFVSVWCIIPGILSDKHQQAFFVSNNVLFIAHNQGYQTTSARSEQIQIQPIGICVVKYIKDQHTASTQTPVSPVQCCQCSHWINDPGCTFKKRLKEWKQHLYDAACSWTWVYAYYGQRLSIDHIPWSGCTRRATWPIYSCP
jgi:hypothetical protein